MFITFVCFVLRRLRTNITHIPSSKRLFDYILQSDNFIGKQALLEAQAQHQNKHLVCVTLEEHDDDNFPWGGEPILRNGSMVGSTTSACYSFREGRPVCLAYLEGEGQNSVVPGGIFEIEIASSLFPVSVSFH